LGDLGASGELRAKVSDQWREIALLAPDNPTKPIRTLAAIAETLPYLEAELRAAGYEMLADRFARFTVAASLWLELTTTDTIAEPHISLRCRVGRHETQPSRTGTPFASLPCEPWCWQAHIRQYGRPTT
jgi:hypothetical protein